MLELQKKEWLPIIDWFAKRHNIEIEPSQSIFEPKFSKNARENIRKHLLSHSFDAMQGFTFGVDAIKSLLLMSALVEKQITVEKATNLARLETNFQVSGMPVNFDC